MNNQRVLTAIVAGFFLIFIAKSAIANNMTDEDVYEFCDKINRQSVFGFSGYQGDNILRGICKSNNLVMQARRNGNKTDAARCHNAKLLLIQEYFQRYPQIADRDMETQCGIYFGR